MEQQNFTHHLFVIEMLKDSEILFSEIQNMKRLHIFLYTKLHADGYLI